MDANTIILQRKQLGLKEVCWLSQGRTIDRGRAALGSWTYPVVTVVLMPLHLEVQVHPSLPSAEMAIQLFKGRCSLSLGSQLQHRNTVTETRSASAHALGVSQGSRVPLACTRSKPDCVYFQEAEKWHYGAEALRTWMSWRHPKSWDVSGQPS